MICKALAGNFLAGVLYLSTKSQQKKLQKNYKTLLQIGFKRVTIWLQQGQTALLSVKSFSSCFLGYRAQVLLLRLFSFTVVIHVPHRRYPASCAKSSSVLDELFCIHKSRKNRLLMRESMTLRHFGGQFACFSAKDIYKVWRGGGLYSGWLCGTVYTINL